MPSLERRKKGIKGEGSNLLQRIDGNGFFICLFLMFYLNNKWHVSKEWSIDLLTHWGGSLSQILDSNFFPGAGRSQGGGGQGEMEEANEEESRYILGTCGWEESEGKKTRGRMVHKIEAGDDTTKSYCSLNLVQTVCLPVLQQHHLSHPLQPPAQPIPYLLSRGPCLLWQQK